ncbi:lysophospholipid acyltransferase family protein [soil metagenome]
MKFTSRLLYYFFLLPISVLPFGILHLLSTILFWALFYVIGYRKKVVEENLRNSFPEKTDAERKSIEKIFYKNLADIFTEGQKMFSISKQNLAKHISCKNPEVANKYFDDGKSIIIAVSHFNSWEVLLTGFNSIIKHRAVVIYQPLKDLFFDKKMRDSRTDHGTLMISTKDVKSFFQNPSKELTATVFAIDQSPSHPEKSYWMNFLNQDTPVLFGTEKYAKDFNLPVIYGCLHKISRGKYQLVLTDVSSDPAETSYGEITEKVTKLLEKDILNSPESWLWSHKRWKHKRIVVSDVSI